MTRSLLISLVVAVSVLGGCKAENSASVIAVGLCGPPSDANNCSMAGSCTAFLAATTLNFWLTVSRTGSSLNGPMQYFMQFDNNALDNSNENNYRVNTHDAWLNEVSLSYSVQGSATAPAFGLPGVTERIVPTMIRAGSSATPIVPLFPRGTNDVVARLAANVPAGDAVLVTVTLKGRGKFVDGSSFETGPYTVNTWVIAQDYIDQCMPGPLSQACPAMGESGAKYACSSSTCTTTFSVSGTVSGLLAGNSLTLSMPGASDIPMSGNGAFLFGPALCEGDTYSVTVSTQPAGQHCTVTGGYGTIPIPGANVTGIVVTCT